MKPSRTNDSSTYFDTIFINYNNSGLLLTDINDHLSVITVLDKIQDKSKPKEQRSKVVGIKPLEAFTALRTSGPLFLPQLLRWLP